MRKQQRDGERKEQKIRGSEGKPGKAAMRSYPEKHACPRRGNLKAASAALSRRQTE
jgi:hypothetical protein